MALLTFQVISLNFMEVTVALCFFTISFVMVIERIFFDEIAKNNVIPLRVICGGKSTLIKLFTKKIIYMVIPYLVLVMAISIGWSHLHHVRIVHTLWNCVTVGLLLGVWLQCSFLHFWFMFLGNKATTWFEVGVIVAVNFILQAKQIWNIAAQILALVCVAVLLLVVLVGKQKINSKGEANKDENLPMEKEN